MYSFRSCSFNNITILSVYIVSNGIVVGQNVEEAILLVLQA